MSFPKFPMFRVLAAIEAAKSVGDLLMADRLMTAAIANCRTRGTAVSLESAQCLDCHPETEGWQEEGEEFRSRWWREVYSDGFVPETEVFPTSSSMCSHHDLVVLQHGAGYACIPAPMLSQKAWSLLAKGEGRKVIPLKRHLRRDPQENPAATALVAAVAGEVAGHVDMGLLQ